MEYLHETDRLPPEPWNGHIHSVFRHSCNVMADDGLLVTLHCFPGRVLPRSYYIPGLDTGCFRTGMPVAATGQGLLLAGVTIPRGPGCRKRSTRIPVLLGRGMANGQSARALLEQKRREQCRELPLLEPLCRTLIQAGHQLMEALFSGQDRLLHLAVEQCVGFGYGLTPSGDDLLVGMLAVLHTCGMEALSLREAVWNRRRHTNDISRTYLEMALRGHGASFVREAAQSLFGIGGETAQHRLLEVGHTSGADVMEGMLIACGYVSVPGGCRIGGK